MLRDETDIDILPSISQEISEFPKMSGGAFRLRYLALSAFVWTDEGFGPATERCTLTAGERRTTAD